MWTLLYGGNTRTLIKPIQKTLDGNYTRILQAKFKRSRGHHPTKMQLYNHLLPITKTTQVRRTRHVGHCWRSRDELLRGVLLCTPSHGRAKTRQRARTYIQQISADARCKTRWKRLTIEKGGGKGSGKSVLIA